MASKPKKIPKAAWKEEARELKKPPKAAWKKELDVVSRTTTRRREDQLLRSIRIMLKIQLMRERSEPTAAGWKPVCPICNEVIVEPPDMHEAIYTRRDVQGAQWNIRKEIHASWNCVLVHNKCNTIGNTEESRRACIHHLIEREGFMYVNQKTRELGGATSKWTDLINSRVSILKEVYNEMQEEAKDAARNAMV